MPSKIEDTFCVQVDENTWCAVLGNHYPNFPATLSLRQAEAIADGEDMESEPPGKTWCTQRLCDQTNVQYKHVLVQAPTCPECLRIRALMIEFARPADQEEDNGGNESEGRRDAVGTDVVREEQLGDPA